MGGLNGHGPNSTKKAVGQDIGMTLGKLTCFQPSISKTRRCWKQPVCQFPRTIHKFVSKWTRISISIRRDMDQSLWNLQTWGCFLNINRIYPLFRVAASAVYHFVRPRETRLDVSRLVEASLWMKWSPRWTKSCQGCSISVPSRHSERTMGTTGWVSRANNGRKYENTNSEQHSGRCCWLLW